MRQYAIRHKLRRRTTAVFSPKNKPDYYVPKNINLYMYDSFYVVSCVSFLPTLRTEVQAKAVCFDTLDSWLAWYFSLRPFVDPCRSFLRKLRTLMHRLSINKDNESNNTELSSWKNKHISLKRLRPNSFVIWMRTAAQIHGAICVFR